MKDVIWFGGEAQGTLWSRNHSTTLKTSRRELLCWRELTWKRSLGKGGGQGPTTVEASCPHPHLLSHMHHLSESTGGLLAACKQAEAGLDYICSAVSSLGWIVSVLLFPLATLWPYFLCLSKPHSHPFPFRSFFSTNHILFPLELSAHPIPAEEIGLDISMIHGSLSLSVNWTRALCLAKGNLLEPNRFSPSVI